VLPNCDMDSGNLTKAAEYSLTDEAYPKLLAQLSERKFDQTSPELRANILDFYSDLTAPIETKTEPAPLAECSEIAGPIKAVPSGSGCRRHHCILIRTR
jgi:hypothetical protein